MLLSRKLELLRSWSAINTYSFNREGLSQFSGEIEALLSILGVSVQSLALPPADVYQGSEFKTVNTSNALYAQKRPNALFKVLLCGHMDTVYPPGQAWECREDSDWLFGPGVADMKGGLLVLLAALQQYESETVSDALGWGVLLTPDEEIGSPFSSALFSSIVPAYDLCLVFEPALANGHMISSRYGSLNAVVNVTGKSSHVGRNFSDGVSAILSLNKWIEIMQDMLSDTVLFNVGRINGGTAANVVAENSSCLVNIRAETLADFSTAESVFKKSLDMLATCQEVGVAHQIVSRRPPKPCDSVHQYWIQELVNCSQQSGMDLKFESTAGVCDGNTIVDLGVPCIDTMGPWGRDLHSEKEAVYLPSIDSKVQLTYDFLTQLAINAETYK